MSATHACSEALQGNGLRPGLKPFGEEDETLRRCDYHRGDTQLLICVRNPQQIHRAEPLSNINENVQRQIKDTQRRKRS
ncbi:hypothetical protein NKJ80_30475 [Mesorhizobium sp. M0030]|uniref:hypothetical protein n=1 Tax=Mesorhizobium sp. LNJC395A00 TaxID=1287275 RepID=UPI0003CEB6B6|nr:MULTISPECIES: hypothetical protein [unclassified Mesorhizobium]ESY10654.1 hypothetical protein X751_30865 [Mesorhizobium sp. LNJC395A00]WJI74914.1 hypothetical protein NLY37_29210 [Mesorhizobium sp. C395A]